MFSLINGIMQLRFYTVAEKIICARNHFQDSKSECWNRLFPTKEDAFVFWPGVFIWIFFGLLFGILIVSFLNWKRKLSPLNTILVAIVMYIIIRLKFFRRGIISRLFHPFRALFSDDFGIQCLFEGITFTLIGLFILYISVNPNLFSLQKNTVEI